VRKRLFGLPVGVWLLWAAAVTVLACCPVIVSDPGMWPYLFDPELLALVVVVGVRYSRLEAGVLWLRARTWWFSRRSACRSPRGSQELPRAVDPPREVGVVADAVRLDQDKCRHLLCAHAQRLHVRFAQRGPGAVRAQPHHQPVTAHAAEELTADGEGSAADHALLDCLVAEQVAQPDE
jgi:hypothetical protein